MHASAPSPGPPVLGRLGDGSLLQGRLGLQRPLLRPFPSSPPLRPDRALATLIFAQPE